MSIHSLPPGCFLTHVVKSYRSSCTLHKPSAPSSACFPFIQSSTTPIGLSLLVGYFLVTPVATVSSLGAISCEQMSTDYFDRFLKTYHYHTSNRIVVHCLRICLQIGAGSLDRRISHLNMIRLTTHRQLSSHVNCFIYRCPSSY